MANTLKFGDGQWATKKGSTLAYNDENGNFKPLPFNFERSTGATRVNKDGLIEVVSNNEPRIDFKDNTKGALLLEPSRSNLFTYSEAINQGSWAKSNASIIEDTTISPNGIQSAETFSITSNFGFFYKAPSLASGTTVTQSIFVKNIDADRINLQVRTASTAGLASFFFTNSEITNVQLTNGISADFDNYGNGWYRVYLTCTTTETNQLFRFQLNQSGMSCYVWGAQLEEGSYATSYIPTSGQSGGVTRVGESTVNNLSNQVSLTEGVFYIDVTNLGRSQNANILTQNSAVNSVYGYIQTNDKIVFGLFANSVSIPITSSLGYTIGARTKIAFHYKSGNSKLYVNGSLAGNSTDTFTIGSGFADAIRLIDNSSAYVAFPEKSTVNEFKVYNTGLTDQELIALTS